MHIDYIAVQVNRWIFEVNFFVLITVFPYVLIICPRQHRAYNKLVLDRVSTLSSAVIIMPSNIATYTGPYIVNLPASDGGIFVVE